MKYRFVIPGSKGIPWLYWDGGGWTGDINSALLMDPSDVTLQVGNAFPGSGGRMMLAATLI